MDIVIPGLGDIDEVEVIEICAAVGDTLEVDDPVIVIESDKASMELPAPAAGELTSLLVALGDRIGEGHVVGVIDAAEAVVSAPADAPEEDQSAPAAAQEAAAATRDASAPDEPNKAQTEQAAQLDVLVPDIGDATGVVVIEVAVKPGDEIQEGDLLVVLESDKASMEITADYAGTVLSVAVGEDEEVQQGTHIATLAVTAKAPAESKVEPEPASAPSVPAQSQNEAAQASPAQALQEQSGTHKAAEADAAAAAKIYAGPAVRRLARELGVQLAGIRGTGNRNRVTKDDVKEHVKSLMQAGPSQTAGGLPSEPTVDFAKFGDIELVKRTRIQLRGADNLHRSWVNLPHVTQHDEADITDLERFRASLKQEAEHKGIKITPLAFVIKACCSALREFPFFNASLHTDGEQLVIKRYLNIGMAVDTPEGLVVPVIKQADTKSIFALSAEIADLSVRARDKKLALDDLQGGTFSVSSLGALGGTGFTPIVNAPEVAILGVAKLQTKPQWDGEAFQPRRMLPLSLSYDHRVVNGADGGRFMQHLTTLLSDIRRLAL
jgi:pyruvate dehydrogenase E2 component (dihydrolipoamide acetyltransferase)